MTSRTEPQSAQSAVRRPLSSVAARLLARARKEWAQQQFEAAEQSLANVLTLAPDEPDATRLLGMVAQRLGNHPKAIECFRQVIAMCPQDADLRIGLGISLFERGETDEALTHFRQACKLNPAATSAWFNLGEALGRQAHTEQAVAALRRALELDPTHLSAHLSLARAQANLGKVDAAVAGFREVLRRDPGNAEGWFGLSNLNVVRFDAADAASLQRALARDGLSPDTSSRRPATPTDLEDQLGVWRDPWLGEARICARGDDVFFASRRSPTLAGQVMRVGERYLVHWGSGNSEAWLQFPKQAGDTLHMAKVDPDADFSDDYEDLAFKREHGCR